MSVTQSEIRKVTTELKEEFPFEELDISSDIEFRPVPHANVAANQPVWRVRFDALFGANRTIGLDINGEIFLGRGEAGPEFVGMYDSNDADKLGVSRRHAMLRPTDNKLFLMDLGSTNGTRLNGHSIGVNTPYSVSDGDRITLGRLEFIVTVIKKPTTPKTGALNKTDFPDTLLSIGKNFSSLLRRDDILNQMLDLSVAVTSANEAAVWMIDEQTGELFLEAGKGTGDELARRISVANPVVGQVIESGKCLRANRDEKMGLVEIAPGVMVEAVICVPLIQANITFGSLLVIHREAGNLFGPREEKLLTVIADFAAIALQNARSYQTAEAALNRRIKVITALNHVLSYRLKNHLNATIGYAGLLQTDHKLDIESAFAAEQISEAGNSMAQLVSQLVNTMSLTEEGHFHYAPCDLIEAVSHAVDDLRDAAHAKSIAVDFEIIGEAYQVQGDAAHLYHSVLNLVDNAIRYSPEGAKVSVSLIFWKKDVHIRVRDNGSGIPEDVLPYLFDRYFQGQQASGEEPGIGLGLEVVRATIEAHRGTITARKVPKYGMEFEITLPGSLRIQ